MKTKLEKLLAKQEFRKGLIGHDMGIMVCGDEPCTFITLEYADHYKIYLSVFDDQVPDDQLIVVEASTLEEAQMKAEIEMKSIVNSRIH